MSYKVIHYFEDLQDFSHPYKVGDVFPRLGMNVSQARLNELSSNKNRQGKPLIKLVEEKIEQVEETETNQYTKTEINRMPTVELQNLASEKGIEDASEKTGAELKKILIKILGL